jgi:hypothetical protein
VPHVEPYAVRFHGDLANADGPGRPQDLGGRGTPLRSEKTLGQCR